MSNFIPSNKTDLEIIQQLEQRIGKKLEELNGIKEELSGYVRNEQNQVIELNLYECGLTELPLEICQLHNLTKLSLSHNQLNTLPTEIGHLHNLTHLNLWKNQLSTLPAEIGQLHNLTGLSLPGNQLSILPAVIWQLRNLTVLGLGWNELSTLPAEIGQLRNLTNLGLYSNKLSTLPAEIGQLRNLTELNLDYNQLITLPAEIGQLHNLTNLSLWKNQLSTLPAEIGQLRNLTSLDLHWNQLNILPAEIGQLRNLTSLDLHWNQLNILPAEIGQLRNLTKLDLYGNKLSTLPAEIRQLHNLTNLNLSSNKLSTLPAEIGQLRNLTELNLGYNQLSTLPAEIGQLRNLTELNLGYNQLSTLPAEIGQLRNLTGLNLLSNKLSTLPAEIGQLRNLTYLDLSGNQLSTLPAVIGQLRNLTELKLLKNQLSTLPAEIDQLLPNLTELDLRQNQLSSLPAVIGKLRKLKRLGLSSNRLTQFPKGLLELNLKVKWDRKFNNGVHVRYNPFQTPPVEIVQQGRQAIVDYYAVLEPQPKSNETTAFLPRKKTDLEIIQQLEQRIGKKLNKLTEDENEDEDELRSYVQNWQDQVIELNLHAFNLTKLPLEIFQLRNLTSLDLSENELSSLPAAIGQLRNLTNINLSQNQLSSLPAAIGQLRNLTNLNLSQNQLSSLPAAISQLRNLTNLNLSQNQLSSLPAAIGQLHNVTNLNLSQNQLSSLPAAIGQLHNVTELDLCANQLSTLPAAISQLYNLTYLGLDFNQLNTLSVKIGQLRNLTRFYLGHNQLSTLPAEIGQLHNLTDLDLSGNQLSTFPATISQLRKLIQLNLSSNKLTQFPMVLLELNLKVIMGTPFFFLENGIFVTDNTFQTPPIEIVQQGRQAIIDYYAALEQPRPLHEAKLILIGDGAAGKTSLMKRLLGQAFDPQESQTHGINIHTLPLLDPHHNAIKLHCWDFGGQQIMHATHQFFLSKRCLYLLVIDSRRESQVEYWLKHIQAFGDNAPVIIVINKIDENPHFDLPQPRQLKQRYPNLKHIHRLSCRTEQGLPELNHLIQNTLPAIDLIHTLIPNTWFNVKTAIAEQAQRSNFASYEQYVDLCASNGINSASEQTTLINFLHDLGCIHHFPDRWLRETNVINPQWLTEAVYTIINAPQLAGHGKLHRNDLINLLDHSIYPERKHDYILELMQKFELCYAINDHEYLLPDLFPVAEPDFNFDSSHALQFIVEYDFLPKSVFTRLVIKLHHAIVPNAYWRTGVLLRDVNSNTVALVETTTNPNRITFQISGPQQQEYLVILRFMLQDINRSFNQLRITEQLLGVVMQPTATELLSGINKIIRMLETQGFSEEKDLRDHIDDVVKFNPSVFGVSVDVNAILKKVWPRRPASTMEMQ